MKTTIISWYLYMIYIYDHCKELWCFFFSVMSYIKPEAFTWDRLALTQNHHSIIYSRKIISNLNIFGHSNTIFYTTMVLYNCMIRLMVSNYCSLQKIICRFKVQTYIPNRPASSRRKYVKRLICVSALNSIELLYLSILIL